MNIIVLQHIKIEDPGYIKGLMLADAVNLTTIELDEGEKIPKDLSKFDGMFCMGGPMDTYMEKQYPWLIEEKKAIKEFVVDLKKPYLGFCLGCQLLGEVVGGKVIKSNPAEIGIMDINFLKEKSEDKLFSSSCTSYECHCKLLICSGNFEKKLSLFFSLLKLISIIPISAEFDFTTLPPNTSPNNWQPRQKPK